MASKRYKRFVKRANLYDMIFMKRTAIKIMYAALKEPLTDHEKSSAMIYMGLLYGELREYEKASDHFHNGLSLVEHQAFYYSPNFKKILSIFYKNNDLERAAYWFENFNRRNAYDKNFEQLEFFSKRKLK